MVARRELNDAEKNKLIVWLNKLLDHGCSSQAITIEIFRCVNDNRQFDWTLMSNVNSENLLTSGIRYYHKSLLLMNSPSVVNHNVDEGTFVSQQEEYFLEPRASFTIDELVKFFYQKTNADRNVFNPKRMAGFLRTLIKNFGIDLTMFLIEAASRIENKRGINFDLNTLTDNISTAQGFLDDIKHNCMESGGNEYVIRKRMPPA